MHEASEDVSEIASWYKLEERIRVKKNSHHLIFALTLAVLLMEGQAVLAQRRAASPQNLDETQRLITETLLKHSIYPHQEEKYSWTIKVEAVNFEGCFIDIKLITTGMNSAHSSYTVELADLDPLNIKVVEPRGSPDKIYYLQLNTVEMKYRARFRYKGRSLELDRPINYVGLFFIDKEMAQRGAELFARAIKLCVGSKKEAGRAGDKSNPQHHISLDQTPR